ncbi:alpha-amylase family glycosyl hydrolase [Echinicola jeungdonensis]|uniref:Alpha-amylase family glycosyl hydrolase n=1 Tax=Echinicola jeungdonensis TaxID=709343 RepID=A0ABV5J4E3_9BACT|nr:alpha-amylase family glycosyl hydrolase [Echinicola jeungdonensis]MDN3667901.1 alpha-amylase family glycosyl hydrolase [Echinicola jeungdonensis]
MLKNLKTNPIYLLLILLAGCSTKTEKASKEIKNYWPEAGITYEIFIQSYYDTDGDSIGDVNGVIQKLDHVRDLGANAIWFMPIMPSPSYHKYDVTDYKAIHPDYGNMEDFKRLIEEAHKRDIKVVIDMIINHTSDEHPWFLEAKKGRDNPYRDYYVWAQADTIQDYLDKKTITLDSDNIRQWHDPGKGNDYYYGFFTGDMPDLNFDNPKVREEIYDIGEYWLEEVGVDGFRLDAAKHIYPDDRAEDNHAFWKEFRAEMEKVNPDVYLVGEVYDMKEVVAPYLPGLPALFNFDFHYTLLEAFEKQDGMLLARKQKEILDYYQGITDDFIDATISSNHDQPRLLNELGKDENKMKQAIAILMTMPGAPYLYYGEEIGMLGKKPDPHIREPFLWKAREKDEGRTKWIQPEFSTDKTVTPLSQQKENPNSYYNHYKTLIELRNTNPALAIGELELVENGFPKAVMAFKRKVGEQELFVLHNVGENEVEVELAENLHKAVYALNGAAMKEGKVILPGNGSLVLE